ncbi:MAG TPA: cytochrome c oxidase assembly protein [Terriglobales bacterium]|jgi:putative membrane protein|nr:cytochrome c oxidase assembly protein [Terriglobales bacterium]
MRNAFSIRSLTVLLITCVWPLLLWGHEADSREAAMRWSWEPFVIIPILATVALYAAGQVRMWRRSGDGLRVWPIVSFAGGVAALVIALDSPVHLLGGQLFWVHMTQHELLMLVAAPLLVMAHPLVAFLWALPRHWREQLGRASKSRIWTGIWMAISSAAAAWIIHAVVLWLWHAPALFEAALHSEWIHASQHLCFLGSALLFWWTLVHGRHGRLGYGAAVVYVFTTAAHNSVLGALLTFAPRSWYPTYTLTTKAWSVTALEDQQLGGLIMWVPAGALLMVIGLALLAAWMGESQRRFQYTRMASLMKMKTSGVADAP